VSRSVFLVQRRAILWGELGRLADHPTFAPYVPLRLFTDRAAADAYRDDIVGRLRPAVNPFDLERPPMSMADSAFVSCLWGLDVVPPEPKVVGSHGRWHECFDWRAWWNETAPTLSPEQVEAVWALFDRLRLVEVVELPLGG
jgi:hypothetical protein